MPGKLLPKVNFSPGTATKKLLQKSSILSNASTPAAVKAKSASHSSSSADQSFLGADSDSMDLLKRHKLALGHSNKAGKSKAQDEGLPKPATLSLAVESPPLVSYGPQEESSGALFSGQFKINVKGPEALEVAQIQIKLLSTTTIKKPAVSSCPDCSGGTKELKEWNYVKDKPLKLIAGEHKFPVSFLFPGNLPETSHSLMALLDYHFAAVVKTGSGQELTLYHTVELKRAIRPGAERNSVRVFPPTNMTASVFLTPVNYTNSDIQVRLRLSGINGTGDRSDYRWRIRRILWRVEEHQQMMSPYCNKHKDRCPEGKAGLKHEEVKTVGDAEINFNKNPWKTDLSAGEIDSEFVASIDPKRNCLVGATNTDINLTIWHQLVVEMIVLEEHLPKKRNAPPTPTGAARILRSQFPLRITNRAGMGVAWDEEMPPVYSDVPPSPPGYQHGDADAPPLPEDVDTAASTPIMTPPTMTPPTYASTAVIDVDIATVIDDFHLGEPHELARHSAVPGSSSSVVTRRSSGSSGDMPPPHRQRQQYSRARFSEDDLLQEPDYPQRRESVEEEPDIQVA